MHAAKKLSPAEELELIEIELNLRRMGVDTTKVAARADSLAYRDWLPVVSPTFVWHWRQTRYIIDHVEKVLAGEIKKLMIFMPPRHTKSETVTVRLPAYILERDPTQRIIVGAYNQTLAEKFSRKTRRIAAPRVALATDRTAVSDWETEAGGGVRAAGVGAGVTGMGANLILIDDPVKSRAEANSETYREKCFDWYTDDLYTRLEPGGAIILIMCMTGDTPVLMADGTERPLRDIKVGDKIATYDNGKLSASVVKNHKSNGLDFIYKIKTTCGRVVFANERHPFLVEERGQRRWIRLKNLNTAHKIVTVKGNGGSGRGSRALSRAAKSLSAHAATALHITAKRCGQTGIVHQRSMQSTGAICDSNKGTGSRLLNMMRCFWRKTGSALFANSHPETTSGRIGAASYASTTATKPTPSGLSYATTATSLSDTPKTRKQPTPWQNTSDFTVAQIESIEPAGAEEVFDIQVEHTENFIANGLVSHNTRWHEDDLAGRILASEDAPNWTVVNLPALAEANDPLGREEGEALCPERYTREALLAIKKVMGSGFEALYQGRPAAAEGEIFLREWWRYYKEAPQIKRVVLSWDTAFKDKEENDYCACGIWGWDGVNHYLLDRWKEKATYPVLKRTAKALAKKWGPRAVLIEDKASGQSLIQELTVETDMPVLAIPVDKDKVSRAHAVTPTIEAGKVYLPENAPWLQDFIDELANFPNGSHDDDVDQTTQYLNWSRRRGEAAFSDYAEAAKVNQTKNHEWAQIGNSPAYQCRGCGIAVRVTEGQTAQEVAEKQGFKECKGK